MAPAPAKRRWRRALLALALSASLALLAAELVARLVWGAPLAEREPLMQARANPTRGYEMIPGQTHYTYLHEVRVNALGLRGPEPAPSSDGALRVLCLGDSFVYGQGVAESATIPAQLEAALNRWGSGSGRAVQVWNGGYRAYNTEQELALLEQLAPRLHPELVVLVWYPNDLEQVDIAGLAARLAASGPITFDVGQRFEGAAARAWRWKQFLRRSALLMRAHDLWNEWHFRAPESSGTEHGFERLERSFARLAELGRRDGYDVLVSTLPSSDQLATDAVDSTAARVVALAARSGLARVELLAGLRALRRRDGRAHVLAYDGHYDGGAYAAVAEQIAQELEQQFPGRFGR